jgi:hypothetical protein
MMVRYARGFERPAGPSQPFVATKDGPKQLRPLNVDMNDELPEHSAPPRDSAAQAIATPTDDDGLGIPAMFDRRKAKAVQNEAAPSYVDLVTK